VTALALPLLKTVCSRSDQLISTAPASQGAFYGGSAQSTTPSKTV
jgi:hypothetical protein